MFKKIEIKNFKSLKELNINLKDLTLLTGINSSGKSSTIQALLLIKQNLETKTYMYETLETLKKSKEYDSKTIDDVFKVLINTLKIKGEYLDLGAAKNILYSGADNDEMDEQSRKEADWTRIFETFTHNLKRRLLNVSAISQPD